MVLGAVALQDKAVRFEGGGESFGVFDDVFGVGFEFGLEVFFKCDGFGSNNVFERATLSTREDGAVD